MSKYSELPWIIVPCADCGNPAVEGRAWCDSCRPRRKQRDACRTRLRTGLRTVVTLRRLLSNKSLSMMERWQLERELSYSIEYRRIENAKYRRENRERINELRRKLRDPEKERVRNRKYRVKNRDQMHARAAKRRRTDHGRLVGRLAAQRRRLQLTDGYVRRQLTTGTPLRPADIPPELVALKRAEIQIKRYIKENNL